MENTIAQEQKETCQNISDENQTQKAAHIDLIEKVYEDKETSPFERTVFYCDLTGVPIYL